MIIRDLIKRLSEKDDTFPVMVYVDGEPVEVADVDTDISDRVDLVIGEYVIDNRVEELEEKVEKLEKRLAKKINEENNKIREQLKEANKMLSGAKHLTVRDSNGVVMFELVSPEINEYLNKWGIK